MLTFFYSILACILNPDPLEMVCSYFVVVILVGIQKNVQQLTPDCHHDILACHTVILYSTC